MHRMDLSLAIVSLINAHNIHYHASIQLVRILTEVAIKRSDSYSESHTLMLHRLYSFSFEMAL